MCPMKYSTWSVTTWYIFFNYNSIMKKWSKNAKALVEASKTIYNNPLKQKRKTKRSNVQVTVERMCAGNIQGMHMHNNLFIYLLIIFIHPRMTLY